MRAHPVHGVGRLGKVGRMSAKSKGTSSSVGSPKLTAAERRTPLGGPVWKIMSVSATLLATRAATKGADGVWRAMTGKPVPNKGDYERQGTGEVIAFTALSSMLVAGARVAAERKAAEYYRDSAGHLPSALAGPSKEDKKAQKKLEKEAKKAEKSAAKLRSS